MPQKVALHTYSFNTPSLNDNHLSPSAHVEVYWFSRGLLTSLYTATLSYKWLTSYNLETGPSLSFKWPWKVNIPEKIIIFLWLILHRNLANSPACPTLFPWDWGLSTLLEDFPQAREVWLQLGLRNLISSPVTIRTSWRCTLWLNMASCLLQGCGGYGIGVTRRFFMIVIGVLLKNFIILFIFMMILSYQWCSIVISMMLN